MELPLAFSYEGWNIRYSLTSATEQPSKSVVFVHGTPWSSVVYKPIIDALKATKPFQILAYDLPGYGNSRDFDAGSNSTMRNGFQGDTSVKFQASALAALLQHLHLDGRDGQTRPAVVAHDIAGAIVLRAHLLHDVQFESMMLLDTNAVLPWGDGFYKLARSNPQVFLDLPPNIFAAVVRSVIHSACHNPKALSENLEQALAGPWIGTTSENAGTLNSQSNFIRQIAQANDDDVCEMLEKNLYAQVRCDVKLLSGEQDEWIPAVKVKELAERLGDRAKEIAWIPEAGHLVMIDQPARVAIEIFRWLDH